MKTNEFGTPKKLNSKGSPPVSFVYIINSTNIHVEIGNATKLRTVTPMFRRHHGRDQRASYPTQVSGELVLTLGHRR